MYILDNNINICYDISVLKGGNIMKGNAMVLKILRRKPRIIIKPKKPVIRIKKRKAQAVMWNNMVLGAGLPPKSAA